MYRTGHYGVSLLVYAPVGFALLSAGEVTLAFVVGAGLLWLATLPDVDHRIPGVSHRGVTHTLAFALLVGVALGGAGYALESSVDVTERTTLATVGFFVGVVGIAAHLLGDALTPMGIRPLWPLSGRTYSLSLTRADSVVWNYALLALGVFATAAAAYAAVVLQRGPV